MLLEKIRMQESLVRLKDGDEYHIKRDTDILIISDMHIDYKKIRPFYFREMLTYLDRIIQKLTILDNPTIIFLGDLFNKDLNDQKGILYFEEVESRFKIIEKITKGKCFIVLGNHEVTYYDINPTFLITEVSPVLSKTLVENGIHVTRNGGNILKTPHTIRIGRNKISLNHFRKDGIYKFSKGDCDFHIALYHDTYISYQMEQVIEDKLPISKIWGKHLKDENLNSVSLAMFGDFHIPLPVFRIENASRTICVVPGSFGRNNISTEKHESVKLPIIKIRNDKTDLEIENFNLIPYTQSYNLKESNKNISTLTSRIQKLIKNNETETNHSVQKINIDNYLEYVRLKFGEEYHERMKNIIKGGKR